MTVVYTWARKDPNGYECSSKGDKRFSAFYAQIGRVTIEYLYQVEVKGYESIKEGKGKPPLTHYSREDLWAEYLLLWEVYFVHNKDLLEELRSKLKELNCTVLTDMFATSDINQARAIATILNRTTH